MTSQVDFLNYSWTPTGRSEPALSSITTQVSHGEKVLIVGPSGCGKSTLLSLVSGVLHDGEGGHSTGELKVNGHDPYPARGEVGLLLQDPESQTVAQTIGDDCAFGCENLGVDPQKIWERVQAALSAVGLTYPLTHPTDELSGGQKQRLALAGIFAMQPGTMCLDEPTANIDPESIEELVSAVLDNAKDSILLVVEHTIEPWIDHMDRMIVLDHSGSIVADDSPQKVLADPRLFEYGVWVPGVALDLSAPSSAIDLEHHTVSDEHVDVVVRAEDLSVGWKPSAPIRTGDHFEFSRGLTCITGPNGCGKTTALLTLAGVLPALAGSVSMPEYSPSDPLSWPSHQLASRVGMVFQQPQHQFVTSTVLDEMLATPKALKLDHALSMTRAQDLLHQLGLEQYAQSNPFTLSGGQQRRLSVATALMATPDILYLDEPTFGQDRNTFLSVVSLLLSEAAQRAVVVVTHDRHLLDLVSGEGFGGVDDRILALAPQPTADRGDDVHE